MQNQAIAMETMQAPAIVMEAVRPPAIVMENVRSPRMPSTAAPVHTPSFTTSPPVCIQASAATLPTAFTTPNLPLAPGTAGTLLQSVPMSPMPPMSPLLGGVMFPSSSRLTSSLAGSPIISPRLNQGEALWNASGGVGLGSGYVPSCGVDSVMSTMNSYQYSPGDRVEVFSKSTGYWCQGMVQSTDPTGAVCVDFRLPDGSMQGKILPGNHAQLRRAPFRGSSPSQMRPPSPPPLVSGPGLMLPPSPRRQASLTSFSSDPQGVGASIIVGPAPQYSPAPQVLRSLSGPLLQPQVMRTVSSAGFQGQMLPPQGMIPQAFQNYGPPNVQSLEQQLSECRSMLAQTKENSAAMLQDRDQRLSTQDRLVEDLRQAIDSQRREAEELRRQQCELLETNQSQAERLADLEALLQDMDEEGPPRSQRPNSRPMPQSQRGPPQSQRAPPQSQRAPPQSQRGRPPQSRLQSRPKAPPPPPWDDGPGRSSSQNSARGDSLALLPSGDHQNHLLGGDAIDLCLQEFFDMNPDFDIAITKHKPGWYTFGEPIKKKVYLKIVGDNVIVRSGGGHFELHKWLSQYHLRARDRAKAD